MREPDRRDDRDTKRAGGERPSSFRAAIDALRNVPELLKRPESLLLVLAIMASLGAHIFPYLSLGALADYFKEKEREELTKKAPPVTFEVLDQPAPKPEPVKPLTPRQLAKQKAEEKKKAAEEKKEEEQKKVAEPEVPQPPQPPQPEPPPPVPHQERKQSITQKSADPNVEPPPDSKFLAEENQRVEEETTAEVTSESKNDPNPQAAAPQAAGPEKSGDSHSDERGAEKGSKEEKQQQVASMDRSSQNNPRPAPPDNTPPQNAQNKPSKPGPVAPQNAPAEQVFHDPLGSFTLAASDPSQVPAGAQGSGAAGKQANIKVSWRAFEQTFGAEQLAQDRMPKEAKRRGAGREKRWDEFRAAIENYVVGVKPGNTTRLNAAADPFAAYLAAFHRNLHIEFAHDFLASLPMAGELANPSLVTMVEIVVNPDGSLDRVGVVKASGNLMYDFGAFNAVQRGAPYPPTPEKIRSPDGRVYIKWALHRNESQCGTWNAEPYILKNPPRSPNDPKQDNVSPYRPGGASGQGGGGKGAPSGGGSVTQGETLGLLDTRARIAPPGTRASAR